MNRRRLRFAAFAAAAVTAFGLAATPLSAAAVPSQRAAHRSPAAHVRNYDETLLSDANSARSTAGVKHYAMNHKLWKIAHAWAKHLAKTGVLAHNPLLVPDVTQACPKWSATGENVGVTYGEGVHQLFEAYMHSPPHRANILDQRYSQVGIATVRVVKNGQVQQWDVMDFSNHC